MNKIKNRIKNMKETWNELYSAEEKGKIIGLGTVAIGFLAAGTAIDIINCYHNQSEVITLKTATLNDKANTQLLTAAFENNVDDFKQALKNGAQVTTPNQHNQNVLMIALARDAYDVSNYILSTPQLRDKIDYKQADDKGVTAIDIIQSKINYALHKTGRHASPKEPAPELEMAKRIVIQQLQKQNQEEAKGHTRSNTKYDAFTKAMQNQGNTGK